MNTIRNIWKEANVDLEHDKVTPLDILEKQAESLNEDSDKTNLHGVVMSFSSAHNEQIDEVKHTLFLFPKNGEGYNYKFIELVCKPDHDYPLQVYAYQSGDRDFGSCENEDELYTVLENIFTDPRLKNVFEQLKHIGNKIDWRREVEQ